MRNSSKQHLIHAAHQIPTVPVPVQTSSNNHFCKALHVGCINYVTCNATGAPQNLEQPTSCSLPFAIPGWLSPLLYIFLFSPSLYSKSQLSDKGVCVCAEVVRMQRWKFFHPLTLDFLDCIFSGMTQFPTPPFRAERGVLDCWFGCIFGCEPSFGRWWWNFSFHVLKIWWEKFKIL